MSAPIDHFRTCIQRVKELHALHDRIRLALTPAVDLSDLLRAEFVLAVSALDYFVHEHVRVGLIDTFISRRKAAVGLAKFNVSLESLVNAGSDISVPNWLDEEIRSRNGFLSFQQPEKIADAIRLISDVRLWDAVGSGLGMAGGDVKVRLKLIVDRRNKIAHEADLDPSYPGVRWPISSGDAASAIDFIEAVCEQIHSVA